MSAIAAPAPAQSVQAVDWWPTPKWWAATILAASGLLATWGGTGFNFELKAETFETYINSAVRYREVVAKSGADILLSNHTRLDGSTTKLPAMATRKPGDKHPYVIGNDAVQRYIKVAEECARANLLRLKQ